MESSFILRFNPIRTKNQAKNKFWFRVLEDYSSSCQTFTLRFLNRLRRYAGITGRSFVGLVVRRQLHLLEILLQTTFWDSLLPEVAIVSLLLPRFLSFSILPWCQLRNQKNKNFWSSPLVNEKGVKSHLGSTINFRISKPKPIKIHLTKIQITSYAFKRASWVFSFKNCFTSRNCLTA